MSRCDFQCKRNSHRHDPGCSRVCHRNETRRPDQQQPKEQCELVNKIASIDIWATERLYNKWRRQAIAQKQSPNKATDRTIVQYNYNTTELSCLKHGGKAMGRGCQYFKARLANSNNPKRQAACNPDEAIARRDVVTPEQQVCLNRGQRQQQQDMQHIIQNRHGRLRRENNQGESRHSQYVTQSREMKSTAPRCSYHLVQQLTHQESEDSRYDVEGVKNLHSSEESYAAHFRRGIPCKSCQLLVLQPDTTEKRHSDKETQVEKNTGSKTTRQPPSEKRPIDCRGHVRQPERTPQTIEALLTINSPETAADRPEVSEKITRNSKMCWNNRTRVSDSTSYNSRSTECCDKPIETHADRLCSNSSRRPFARRRNPSLSSDRVVEVQPRWRSMEQDTFILVRSISCSPMDLTQKKTNKQNSRAVDSVSYSYNIARVCREDQFPIEQAHQLPKPEIFLMMEQPTPGLMSSSCQEDFTVQINRWDKMESSVKLKGTGKTGCRGQKTHSKVPYWASQRLPDRSFACNNSVKSGKSLRMLSTTSREDFDSKTQNSESFCPALVSKVRSASSMKIARASVTQIKMQSNVTSPSNTTSPNDALDDLSDDDLDSFIIQTEQETGEISGIEPKTGSVTRKVQNAVLAAANLLAAKGFAGLLGNRASEGEGEGEDEDDEEEEEEKEEYKSKDEEDGTPKGDDSGDIEIVATDSSKDDDDLPTPKATKPASKSLPTRNSKIKVSQNHGAEASARSSKKLLPMTECPTTQHRIECYRTRAGRVKCFMTARHPVKCSVRGGRIVCKATLNPETSRLPYPCDAAWQYC